MPPQTPKSIDVRRVAKNQPPPAAASPTSRRPFLSLFKKRLPQSRPVPHSSQKSQQTVQKEANFWSEQPLPKTKPPTASPTDTSSSRGMYFMLAIGALLFSAVTVVVAYYVTKSDRKTTSQADTNGSNPYQPISNPGDKNPFTPLDQAEDLTGFTGKDSEPSPTATTTPASTPTPSKPTTTPTTIDKQSIRLRVLNSSGITGDAANMKKQLEQAGFTVSAIGNAQSSYSTSYIYYRIGKNQEADLVADSITNRKITKAESNSIVGANTDVLVIVGKK